MTLKLLNRKRTHEVLLKKVKMKKIAMKEVRTGFRLYAENFVPHLMKPPKAPQRNVLSQLGKNQLPPLKKCQSPKLRSRNIGPKLLSKLNLSQNLPELEFFRKDQVMRALVGKSEKNLHAILLKSKVESFKLYHTGSTH